VIRRFGEHHPQIHPTAWVDPSAQVIGEVELAEGASVWCGAVLRGDVGRLAIGAGSNLQDGCVVHCTGGRTTTTVGRDCTVGHRAILHGCTIADRVLVGMGSIVMDDAQVAEDTIIGAGSLVTPGAIFPPRSLVLGSPARVKRPLTDAEVESIRGSAQHYRRLAAQHRAVVDAGPGAEEQTAGGGGA
jgi:carbonic anhydrase/acetyltransferase-like protein (isoleucine patch superfamily)